jgi:hypothetical protein
MKAPAWQSERNCYFNSSSFAALISGMHETVIQCFLYTISRVVGVFGASQRTFHLQWLILRPACALRCVPIMQYQNTNHATLRLYPNKLRMHPGIIHRRDEGSQVGRSSATTPNTGARKPYRHIFTAGKLSRPRRRVHYQVPVG